MRVGIIGATGMAGSDIYREAVSRGHEVTAIVRNGERATAELGSGAQVLARDAFTLTADDVAGFDVLVNAFAIAPDDAHRHVDLAQHLVSIAGASSPRLVFILGGGSLFSGEDKHLHVEDIRKMPGAEAWVNIPVQQLKELEYLRTVEDVTWVGVSPQAMFAAGPATTPKLGTDEIMLAADGQSHTSSGTLAIAVLDEIENPAHQNTRFTVSDA
ncbi:NAD(P)-dependent oxidoreductase [Kribbia dieselivorans]|uniref:NAD(P)-dependent oxidoreductase n=1 Tax=Kribbia dieselivorans TaxID=331526 RepID=UPI00083987A4|nr:NAD(P)H-binding protein [Kribbia dieselivorans]